MNDTSENKHLEHVLNLLTYDDLDEQQKIEACVEYIRDSAKTSAVVPQEYTSQLFQCTEGMIMDPDDDLLLLDRFADDEDGTFPNVMSFCKLAKAVEDEGGTAWLRWATVKTSVENREYRGDGFTLHWKSNQELCVIVFDKPTPFRFGRIGAMDVLHDVNQIAGVITCDSYYMKKPRRQSKYPNEYDVVFNILSFEA